MDSATSLRRLSALLWGYARASTERPLPVQLEVLRAAGVPPKRLLVDDGPVRVHRPQLASFLADVQAGAVPAGAVLAVATLDRLGLTVREMTRVVRELHEHGVGVRTLADDVTVDTSATAAPADRSTTVPTAETEGPGQAGLVLAVLGLVKQAELTYTAERVEVHRVRSGEQGRALGRTRQVPPEQLAEALRLYDEGIPVVEIEQRTGLTRTTFYRLAALERGRPVGVRRRRRPGLPPETAAAILALKDRASRRRAAELPHVSTSTVHRLWALNDQNVRDRQDESPGLAEDTA